MESSSDPIEMAVRRRRTPLAFPLEDRNLIVACLIREADWRPLKAPWWRQKEAYIIGADLDGNFLLRHCDGSVRYWDHKTQSDSVIAASVRDFIGMLA